jgi:hypothetical protein
MAWKDTRKPNKRPARTEAGAGMINGGPVPNANDDIGAPSLRPTRPFNPDSAAIPSTIDRPPLTDGVHETVRTKLVPCGAIPSHAYRDGRPAMWEMPGNRSGKLTPGRISYPFPVEAYDQRSYFGRVPIKTTPAPSLNDVQSRHPDQATGSGNLRMSDC